MDDITNKRFDNLDKKIDGVEARLMADVGARLTNVAKGLEGVIKESLAGTEDRIVDRLGATIAKNHGEQMQRFQAVIDQADGLGRKLGKLEERAEGERDRKIAELAAKVERIDEMLLKLLGGGTKQ